ncbi:FecCD family ABC transporter permease [Rhodococcus sp. 3Y1]
MLVPLRMVLAGVAIGYLLSAATSFVQLRADPSQLSGVLFWLLGSVSGASWSDLGVPAAVITVCAAILLTQSRQLNALAMGDESAQSVGVDVRRTRLLLLVIASLLTAVVVSVAGESVSWGCSCRTPYDFWSVPITASCSPRPRWLVPPSW